MAIGPLKRLFKTNWSFFASKVPFSDIWLLFYKNINFNKYCHYTIYLHCNSNFIIFFVRGGGQLFRNDS